MELEDCRMLFRHAEWADAMVWKSVLASGTGDTEIREKLHHLHTVQWAYLRIWRGEPVAPPAAGTFGTMAAMRDWARDSHRDVAAYVESLTPEVVGGEVRLPWADHLVERFGKARPVTWAETVLQIVMHTGYHRGQIAMRLRELGGEPPLTDLIAWIWMGRPQPEWT